MKKFLIPGALAVCAAFAQPASALVAAAPQAPGAAVTVMLKNEKGADTGKAEVFEAQKGLLVRLEVSGLPEGWHALHFHTTGDCSDHADHFMKSGGHFSLEGEAHGVFAPGGPHAGDMPNIWIGADGTGKAEVFTPTTLALLQDADGSAVMIHAGADDHISQPTGDAGARLACGVIAGAKQE